MVEITLIMFLSLSNTEEVLFNQLLNLTPRDFQILDLLFLNWACSLICPNLLNTLLLHISPKNWSSVNWSWILPVTVYSIQISNTGAGGIETRFQIKTSSSMEVLEGLSHRGLGSSLSRYIGTHQLFSLQASSTFVCWQVHWQIWKGTCQSFPLGLSGSTNNFTTDGERNMARFVQTPVLKYMWWFCHIWKKCFYRGA